MTTAMIKERLHDFIEYGDDKTIQALYIMLQIAWMK